MSRIINDFEIYLNIEADAKQKEKIINEIEKLEKYLNGIDKKLSNQNFLDRASADVIEKEKVKREETNEKLEKLRKLLK